MRQCVCSSCSLSLRARPTSSGSLLLSANQDVIHPCGPRPVIAVLVKERGQMQWESLSQVGKHGEALPLEVGGVGWHCEVGCLVAVRTRDGVLHSARTDEGHSAVVTLPPPTSRPPHAPAHRVEFMVRPPLPLPYAASGRGLVDALAKNMSDAHFLLRPGRLKLAEVPLTSALRSPPNVIGTWPKRDPFESVPLPAEPISLPPISLPPPHIGLDHGQLPDGRRTP